MNTINITEKEFWILLSLVDSAIEDDDDESTIKELKTLKDKLINPDLSDIHIYDIDETNKL